MPPWVQKAGFICGGCTLLFFMGIVLAGLFGHHIGPQEKFPVVLVFSLGVALSFSFLGGSAVANGKIPIFKDSPLGFSVTGGVAVFIICFLTGVWAYPKIQLEEGGNQIINSTGDGNTNSNSK
jgi:hypothetical protein